MRPNPSLNADVPHAGASPPAAGRRLASIVRPLEPSPMDLQLRRVDYFAFVPLLLFLALIKFHTAEFPVRWAYAFLYTLVPALIFCSVGLISFRQCTQLWLGTNLWFALLGFLAVFRAWEPLRVLGTFFQESGGFALTALVGVFSTLVAPGSFIGAPPNPCPMAMRYSWLLVAVAVGGATVSFLSQGNRVLSITVPVVTFTVANFAIRRALTRRHAEA